MSCGLVAVLIAAAAVSGCSKNARAGRPPRAMDQARIIDKFETDPKTDLFSLVDSYYAAGDDQGRVLARNKIIDVTIILIDQHFSVFLTDLSAGRKDFSTVTDLGSIATDAAATLLSPVATKSILAAISGGLTATRVTVDKNYFYDQTLQVIIKQMEAQRRSALLPLISHTDASATAYPLSAALGDLERYYFAGTIDGALDAAVKNASVQEAEADKAISDSISNQRACGPLVEQFLAQSGESRLPLIESLEAWYGRNPGLEDRILSAALALVVERIHTTDGGDEAMESWLGRIGGSVEQAFAFLAEEATGDELVRFTCNMVDRGFSLQVQTQ
jgi:hypothetical protein